MKSLWTIANGPTTPKIEKFSLWRIRMCRSNFPHSFQHILRSLEANLFSFDFMLLLLQARTFMRLVRAYVNTKITPFRKTARQLSHTHSLLVHLCTTHLLRFFSLMLVGAAKTTAINSVICLVYTFHLCSVGKCFAFDLLHEKHIKCQMALKKERKILFFRKCTCVACTVRVLRGKSQATLNKNQSFGCKLQTQLFRPYFHWSLFFFFCRFGAVHTDTQTHKCDEQGNESSEKFNQMLFMLDGQHQLASRWVIGTDTLTNEIHIRRSYSLTSIFISGEFQQPRRRKTHGSLRENPHEILTKFSNVERTAKMILPCVMYGYFTRYMLYIYLKFSRTKNMLYERWTISSMNVYFLTFFAILFLVGWLQ